jgi:hypothetical protein
MFFPNTKTVWNDYFPGISPSQTYVSTFYSTKISPSGPNVYVSNSLFSGCISTSSGGAFSCTSVKFLLFESTSFFSCSTSSINGGAIYISSCNESILYKVCGYDCCSTHTSNSNAQFALISLSNAASNKIFLSYSSISRCIIGRSASWYTLQLINGKICLPSVNVSMNKCQYKSGIICYPYLDSNSITFSMTYTSIADNIATGYNCIYSSTTGSINEIKYCNIIRNTQVTLSSEGTIVSCGNLMISESCILENKADYIFYQGSSSYTITVSNCTVDSVSHTRGFILTNTVTKSFLLALNHMSTKNCHSGYDSVGTITHINPPTSPASPTPPTKEKRVYCYTDRIIHYHARISDFFTFICLFIFTFIHTKV